MGEQNVSLAIEQEVAPGLVDVFAAVRVLLHSFAQQLCVEQKRCGRKNPEPGESFQIKSTVGFALRVDENGKRPSMQLLVTNQLRRLGERHHYDRNPAPIELGLSFFHLAEVSLARQSGEMAQKDQQQMFLKKIGEGCLLAVKIEQRQVG